MRPCVSLCRLKMSEIVHLRSASMHLTRAENKRTASFAFCRPIMRLPPALSESRLLRSPWTEHVRVATKAYLFWTVMSTTLTVSVIQVPCTNAAIYILTVSVVLPRWVKEVVSSICPLRCMLFWLAVITKICVYVTSVFETRSSIT